MTVLETFAVVYQPDALPPTNAEIEQFLATHLAAQHQRPLQWAIVKTDAGTKQLWFEGCCVSDS